MLFKVKKSMYKKFFSGKIFFKFYRIKIIKISDTFFITHSTIVDKERFFIDNIVSLYKKLLNKLPYIAFNNRFMKYVLYEFYSILRSRMFYHSRAQDKKTTICNLKSLTKFIIRKTEIFVEENEISINSIALKVLTEVIKWFSLIITAIGTILYNTEVIFLWLAKF